MAIKKLHFKLREVNNVPFIKNFYEKLEILLHSINTKVNLKLNTKVNSKLNSKVNLEIDTKSEVVSLFNSFKSQI